MLWPFLFEFVTDQNFTGALGVIMHSLAILAQNKKEIVSDEPLIDLDATGL